MLINFHTKMSYKRITYYVSDQGDIKELADEIINYC